jgi:hypothetical protein
VDCGGLAHSDRHPYVSTRRIGSLGRSDVGVVELREDIKNLGGGRDSSPDGG